MANFDGTIDPAASWADVPSLAIDCDNLAGPGGPLNAQAVALAARTKSLKATTDAQTTQIAANSSAISANTSAISTNSTAIAALQANSGVTPGTYGDASHFPTFTVGADGKLTAAGVQNVPSAPDLTPYLQKAGGTMTGAFNLAHGADISSAATVNLTTATGNLVDITGTTTITAITLADGADRIVRFTGILTLTNGASLILPGGANITTAPGDFAFFSGYSGGVVRCTGYTRANGTALAAATPGSLVLLTPGGVTGSGVASIDLENYYDTTYDHYLILGCNVTHATDATDLYLQFKIAGSYVTASYQSHAHDSNGSAATYAGVVSPGSAIKMADAVSNNAAASTSFRVELDFPAETAKWKKVQFSGISTAGGGSNQAKLMNGGGNYIGGTGALTGLRFKASSGNISGTFYVFGVKRT